MLLFDWFKIVTIFDIVYITSIFQHLQRAFVAEWSNSPSLELAYSLEMCSYSFIQPIKGDNHPKL